MFSPKNIDHGNNIKTEDLTKQEQQLEETYKDEFWAKKYDVTMEELKKIGKIGISALIIEAGVKHKSFSM